jgi:glycosyltransferase involved in cell wall biosynthesis
MPLFVEVNGVLLDDTPMPKSLTKKLFRALYLVPKRIFASYGYRQLISRHFKANVNKIVTVHLGYHFDSELKYMNRSRDVQKGTTIAFIGNLHPYQGLFGFILGFNRFLINSGREDIILKIFGDGVDKPRLMKLVNELNINKHVQFVGFIDQGKLNAILKSVQLCISPFAFDRGDEFTISALKTYDYFNAQCAILTSKMDENATFIKKHGLGDYLEMGTEEEIVSKLSWLLSSEGQNAVMECYAENYGWLAERLSWKNRFDIITGELLKEI